MSIQELESAIMNLSIKDLGNLTTWLVDYYEQIWDKQIDDDLESGKFDKLLDEVRISETRLTANGHGLSLQELVKLPLTERHRLLSPFVAEMAEDFANDPELTEFAVLDGEDWDELDANF